MEQAHSKISIDSTDKLVEGIGILAILCLIGLPLFYYGSLPDTIPTHYGANGKADGFGNKSAIWSLLIMSLTTYISMIFLNKWLVAMSKNPERLSSLGDESPEDNLKNIGIATKTIRVLNTLIASTSAYISYTTIQTALGNQNGFGSFSMPLLVALFFGVLIYFLSKLRLSK